MAGVTPTAIAEFRRQLRGRGLDMEGLAAQVDVSRHHLSQILWGHFIGANYWARIRACVTDAEWAILLDVEHCATWNSEQVAKGEAALVWLLRRVCAKCGDELGFKPCVRAVTGRVTHGICPVCYDATLAEARSYLVQTDAGLQVHRSAGGPPANASDRELPPEAFAGNAADAPITCRLG